VTLTIRSEEDDQRQLKMTVEVPEDRVDLGMRQAARRLARDIHVPGFRPGKAPYQVILRRVGREALRREVVEEMVQPVLEEAVEQLEIELSATPSLDKMELEPLVFEFTVPLPPQVVLGDYRAIRKEIEPVLVSDEAVQEALERIRVKHQIVEEVERPAEQGDLVTLSGSGEWRVPPTEPTADEALEESATEAEDAVDAAQNASDEPTGDDLDLATQPGESDQEEEKEGIIFREESIDFILDPEKLFKGTPVVENLLGLSSGDEKSFSFLFPEDYEDEELGGKEGSFRITVLNVKSRQLPDLDDELARQEGDYDTLDALREEKRQQLQEQATNRAKGDLIETIISDLLVDANMVYPPAAVEQEIDGMVNSFMAQVSRAGWKWEDYLKLQGDAGSQLRENFRSQAIEALQRRLVLRQFVVQEKLSVDESDVGAAIEERLRRFSDNEAFAKSMSDYYRSGYGFDVLSSEILMDKVHERLEAIVTGNAPDLETLEGVADDEEE
jgi:trigger factor